MTEKSLKDQAEEIIVAVNRDLQKADSKAPAVQKEIDAKASSLMEKLFGIVSDVDLEAAAERVKALKAKYPEAPPEELAQKLIREKCQRTGAVGAATSGAGLIPGIGTAAAVTLGVAADIGATFKLQAELVLEIAALYDYPLTEEEKQRLVMLITGLSAGTTAAARRAGQAIAVKAGEKFASKSFIKALPVVGVIASAGTNVLSTYVIGQRADAYFRLGPEAVGSWGDSLRAISGVDERKVAGWLTESGRATRAALASGAGRMGEAGSAVVNSAGKMAGTVGPAIGSGATKAGETAQKGLKTYLGWVFFFWRTVFSLIWTVVSFIPRKLMNLFGRKASKESQSQDSLSGQAVESRDDEA